MITRQELLEAVKKLYAGGDGEEEDTELVLRLEDEFPNSQIRDLIFFGPIEYTPEEVVDEAFRREADHARQAGSDTDRRSA